MDKIPFLILGTESDISGGHIYNRKIAEKIDFVELIYRKEEKDFFAFIDWFSNQTKEGRRSAILIDAWGLHNAPPIPPNINFYLLVHLPLALYDSNCIGNTQEYNFWKAAAGIIVPSEQVAGFVRTKTDTKVTCVAPGLELNTNRNVGNTLLQGKESANLDIVGLGSYVEKKGDELLLKALAEVSSPFKLTRVGNVIDKVYYEYLLSLIEAFGLQDNVELLDVVSHEHAISILEKSDVAVFPTSYESYGMAIQESIALDVPVLVSDLIDLRDRFGTIGIKYIENTIESWTAGINQCYTEYITGVGLFGLGEEVNSNRFPSWKQQSEILRQLIMFKS